MADLKRVCIIGSGRWSFIITNIIGTNIKRLDYFNDEVTFFVQGETLCKEQSSNLSTETHEKSVCLPDNVIVISDLVEAAKEAHIIIFVIPQKMISFVCTELFGKIKPTAAGLSLVKGFEALEDGNIDLITHFITSQLKIQTSVLMGTTLYDEVADGKFSETTIGCKDKALAIILKDLIQTDNIRVYVVEDVEATEVFGCLRNVVACGVGFVDGLGLGRNAKATVVRLGLIEMIKFVDIFYPGSKLSTFFESCGIADLATSFQSGSNRHISEEFIKTGEPIQELENKILHESTLEGPATCDKVNYMLRNRDMEAKFPLFTAIHKVFVRELEPELFLKSIQSNPEHTNVRLQHLTW